MATTKTLHMTKRPKVGTRHSRLARYEGKLPGIIYGHGEGNVPVVVDRHEIEVALRHGTRLLKADLDGDEKNLLIKDVQYDYMSKTIIHVDLMPVSLSDTVEVTVPLVLRGTPVGLSEGGALTQPLLNLRISCLVTAIPEEIRVNVAPLHVNEQIRVSELVLPEGVKALDAPDHPVVAISIVIEKEEEVAAVEGAPVAGEPEVVGAKKEEGEEEAAEEGKEKEKK
jgi:large subunit ribosomal protein L25